MPDELFTGVASGQVVGRVVEVTADGPAPLVGVPVRMLGSTLLRRTDARGVFTFRQVPEGDFVFEIMWDRDSNMEADEGFRVPVKMVSRGGTLARVSMGDLQMAQFGGVRAAVSGTSAVEQVNVVADGLSFQLTRDPDGTFSSNRIPGGYVYTVTAVLPGDAPLVSESVRVPVSSGAFSDVALTVAPAPRQAGEWSARLLLPPGFTHAPWDPAGVTAVPYLTPHPDGPVTGGAMDWGEDGVLTISDVAVGVYDVLIDLGDGLAAVFVPNIVFYPGRPMDPDPLLGVLIDTGCGDLCSNNVPDGGQLLGRDAGPACVPGEVLCTGTCINPLQDTDFCGAGPDCMVNPGTRCLQGPCVGGTCDEPEVDAGVPDAAVPDAGIPDAAAPLDAGAPTPDAGPQPDIPPAENVLPMVAFGAAHVADGAVWDDDTGWESGAVCAELLRGDFILEYELTVSLDPLDYMAGFGPSTQRGGGGYPVVNMYWDKGRGLTTDFSTPWVQPFEGTLPPLADHFLRFRRVGGRIDAEYVQPGEVVRHGVVEEDNTGDVCAQVSLYAGITSAHVRYTGSVVSTCSMFVECWPDGDNDSRSPPGSTPQMYCQACPGGFAAVNLGVDCDDANAAIHTGATEVCNGVDDDCDGQRDEALAMVSCYADSDADAFIDRGNVTMACSACPSGFILEAGALGDDCVDTDPTINPHAHESTDLGDNVDSNCSGSTSDLVTQVAPGKSHTCIMLYGGAVRCFGSNGFGQLSNGTPNAVFPNVVDVPVSGASTATVPGTLSATGDHVCRIADDRSMLCWGSNGGGQLGTGSGATTVAAPASVTVGNFIQVSAAESSTCALAASQVAWCWGTGAEGLLGNGGETAFNTPQQVSTGAGAIVGEYEVRVGQGHACARTGTGGGRVKCWGYGVQGQMGNGTNTQKNLVPVEVSGISTATQLSAGGAFTCALLGDKTVQCWGAGGLRQLGDPTLADRNTPFQVPGLAAVEELSSGVCHSCARLTDGTVRCWGCGQEGELGNGLNQSSAAPVTVSGLTDVRNVSCGGFHCCALRTGGDTWCWGDNSQQQLGTAGSGSVPVRLRGF